MKITKIKATNFKSLSNDPIEDFLKLNFIFGFNNSGKSNLLKLIETIFSRKIDPNVTIARTPDGPIERHAHLWSDFWTGIIQNTEYLFNFQRDSSEIDFEVTLEFAPSNDEEKSIIESLINLRYGLAQSELYTISISGKILKLGANTARQSLESVRINTTSFHPLSGTTSLIVELANLLSLFNDSVLFVDYDRYFKKTEEEDNQINELSPTNFRNWLFNSSLSSDVYDDFLSIFHSSSLFNITSTDRGFQENEKSNPFNSHLKHRFQRQTTNLEVLFENEFGSVPLSSFGTGIQQLIYIIFKIHESKCKILLLEEIELNLSPKYQDILVKYIEELLKNNVVLKQAFITSHSPLFCYRSQDRSYQVRMEKGETQIEKFILDAGDLQKLKDAHDFLIKSVYKIKE